MKAQLEQWGESLAIRIPAQLASEAGLEISKPLEIKLVNGNLIIKPFYEYNLDDLLATITDENIHGEISTGTALGNEVW